MYYGLNCMSKSFHCIKKQESPQRMMGIYQKNAEASIDGHPLAKMGPIWASKLVMDNSPLKKMEDTWVHKDINKSINWKSDEDQNIYKVSKQLTEKMIKVDITSNGTNQSYAPQNGMQRDKTHFTSVAFVLRIHELNQEETSNSGTFYKTTGL